MKKKTSHIKQKKQEEHDKFPGYPIYPKGQDIYNKFKEEENIDPENIDAKKSLNPKNEALNEKDFKQDKTGNDLDIPGSELDDAQENIGNEDEENNYYSLGSDNHNDLEENRE